MTYIKKTYGVNETEFVHKFIEYISDHTNGFLYNEHVKTKNSIENVFNKGDLWGINIGDIFWEYKSAASVNIHYNRSVFFNELEEFVRHTFAENQDLFTLNKFMCVDNNIQYPLNKKLNRNVINLCLGIDTDNIIIDHWDNTSDMPSDEFVKTAYHYQRKNRYWKCSVTSAL